MTDPIVLGLKVRVKLKHPEDEGFARRCMEGQVGKVFAIPAHSGEDRVIVKFDGGVHVQALFHPDELELLDL